MDDARREVKRGARRARRDKRRDRERPIASRRETNAHDANA